MNSKKLKDLTIRDNFMFAAVMMEEENCKPFLEMLLGIKIAHVKVSYEKSIVYHPECKGVRMDVFAKDENNTRYDIEMQVQRENLPKRARYYQSQMDMELLARGHGYEELPNTYVIFICDFDPFGENRYKYTFENCCVEKQSLSAEDGKKSIFLNTHGTNGEETPEEIVKFLEFVRKNTPEDKTDYDDAYVKQLQKAMEKVKLSREMESRYMYLEEMIRLERKDAKEEGRQEGEMVAHRENILEILEDLGTVSEKLHSRILSETDIQVLKQMLKLAAKADTMEEFEEAVSNL